MWRNLRVWPAEAVAHARANSNTAARQAHRSEVILCVRTTGLVVSPPKRSCKVGTRRRRLGHVPEQTFKRPLCAGFTTGENEGKSLSQFQTTAVDINLSGFRNCFLIQTKSISKTVWDLARVLGYGQRSPALGACMEASWELMGENCRRGSYATSPNWSPRPAERAVAGVLFA